MVQLAPCCRPIPGDAIVGNLGRGEGLTVHTAECGIGKRLLERDSERWMRVDWAEQPARAFQTAVSLLVTHGKGVLARVAAALAGYLASAANHIAEAARDFDQAIAIDGARPWLRSTSRTTVVVTPWITLVRSDTTCMSAQNRRNPRDATTHGRKA